MRVHDRRDGVVVDVAVTLCDILNRGDRLLFGFVREHGAKGAVTDDADVREFGAVLFINDEPAFIVNIEADVLETETRCVRAPANGY